MSAKKVEAGGPEVKVILNYTGHLSLLSATQEHVSKNKNQSVLLPLTLEHYTTVTCFNQQNMASITFQKSLSKLPLFGALLAGT